MRKHVLCMLVLLLSTLGVMAQDVVVTGKVVTANNEPLPGVSVTVKGTTKGTATDGNGAYTVKAPSNATLTFNFIGYVGQEISVGSRTTINVTLKEDALNLEQVVVIGYGTQKKKDLTGAVAVVSSKDFESRPNTQFADVLSGKTAGVQVISPSGKPNAGFNIRIRGTSTVTSGSQPLYIVDGVPTTDTRSINPNDIENLTVLKDASAAAIYGASGSNGVVLITTKRGKTGETKIDFSAYGSTSSVWKRQDVLNADQYKSLMSELGYITDWSKYTANTDWQDEIFRNGAAQNYQLSASGGNDKTTYFFSGGWLKNDGVVRNNTMDRLNFKVSLDQKVNNWLTAGVNANFSKWHDVDITDNTGVARGGVLLGVQATPPVIGIYNTDGSFTGNPFKLSWENPVSSTDAPIQDYYNNRLLGNVYGEAKILPELKFRSSLGLDYTTTKYDYFLDPFRTDWGRANSGIGRTESNLNNYWISENTFTYNKTLGAKHDLTALAGFVASKNTWELTKMEVKGYAGTAVTTVNGGSTIVSSDGTKQEKSNASFISRLGYTYDNKYLFTANFRADASSVFGPNNKWGYFPSVSAGWRISEEDFFKNVSFINDLKLRAGWGLVGNDQIANYAWFGLINTGANYPIGGSILPGNYPGSIQNEDLKWEETVQTNIGLDVALLNSRISLSADAYVKNTKDLLLNLPVPTATGFDNGLINAGKVRNKGIEFILSTRNLVNKFKWSTDFNISFNRNEVIDVKGLPIYSGDIYDRGNASVVKEGLPLGSFYGYISEGVDPATGNMKYKDVNGNKSFDQGDRTVIGDANPDFIYGLTNTFSYKNWGLNLFLQGVQGNDILNASRIETEGLLDFKNQSAAVLKRWTKPGQITDIPKAEVNNKSNSEVSTRFIEDGSYLRVKSLTLSYDFTSAALKRLKLGTLRLYVTGENLLTFTNYKGFDPEVSVYGNSTEAKVANIAPGIDYGTYPQVRSYLFGVNLSF
ncbi:SusC/RagA family TonB-linked outer membrane protein [Solitalea canadensis]|uniref:TonB-linked outer membrane protein, SusC/RagA family n=1 Tax=Solitalea canadensis (strain ATCC 29591 / DSM 3403 / JCM 21819 / LMG 8368 / NBRC 15130 / NCIMB 12057 / USAM 9D) TaxID=929556 RepID=H8KXN8_SOLCM|nr:TonB-dependent receptor [Solitalea canadensis]AFD05453.1 TonB-linked outer membrane protein, SusC/RagA family [Solitalea canadensis DSM 3403]